MMRIEIVSGSPRTDSVTHRVALHLEKVFNEQTDHEVGVIDMREDGLPPIQSVYNTVDAAPEEYKELAARMLTADAYILVTPEYNGNYSSALQNLFDHFPKRSHKLFAIATASPGALGGIRAALHLQQFIHALFGIGSPYMLITPQVDKKFDEQGNLTDPAFQKSIDTFVSEFLWLGEKLVEEKVAGY
jgi:NAD(P)H-dependent FMN reductase